LPRKRKLSYAQERLEEAQASGVATEIPACRVFGECGGCAWQSVAYAIQLEYKRQWVERAYRAVGRNDVDVPTPLGSPDLYRYRNKMEFSFSARRWLTRAEIASGSSFDREFALGLHASGAFDRVLDMESCPIQSEVADRILALTRTFARESSRRPFDLRRGDGFYRYLAIRVGVNTGETLVNLVTSERDPAVMSAYRDALSAAGASPTSLYNGVTNLPGSTSENAELYHDDGAPMIRERLGSLTFTLAPDTFFQPNTRTAERIAAIVRDFAELSGVERVVDLYCGVGTLSLTIASAAGYVIGLERSEASVAYANANANANGVGNARFLVADVDRDALASIVGSRPDIVVVDPPRAGMHARALRALRELAPTRIVYVSCHPVSQAENVAILCSDGLYRLERLQPVDQFPHTPHVECIALLRRQGNVG
jgi:23S rRNA (uracil1939-C5)-methyltransferase